MTVIKINAITVPADSGDELARRFAARAGAVDGQAGFEGFELLKPVDERTTWLVVTRWRDEESFRAWAQSPAFAQGHRGAGHSDEGHSAAVRTGAAHAGAAHAVDGRAQAHDTAHGAGHAGEAGHGSPIAVSSELWSYEVAGGSSN
jgi:heme-degrading monooxygenase HmoA